MFDLNLLELSIGLDENFEFLFVVICRFNVDSDIVINMVNILERYIYVWMYDE